MTKMIPFSSIVEENGKTIRENNMEKDHNIPVGALVEVKMDSWYGDGACDKTHARLWVIEQGRDCDGTPLYWLSFTPKHKWENIKVQFDEWTVDGDLAQKMFYKVCGGFLEKSLTVIEVTDDLVYGTGSLRWEG